MIQADAPMCEEWGWKKGRDGKEEPSECSHMPVGCANLVSTSVISADVW